MMKMMIRRTMAVVRRGRRKMKSVLLRMKTVLRMMMLVGMTRFLGMTTIPTVLFKMTIFLAPTISSRTAIPRSPMVPLMVVVLKIIEVAGYGRWSCDWRNGQSNCSWPS